MLSVQQASTVALLLTVEWLMADSLMVDSLTADSSMAEWAQASAWVLLLATDVVLVQVLVHALADAFVALSAKFAVCSQAAVAMLTHLLADVQLQQLLLAVADATSQSGKRYVQ